MMHRGESDELQCDRRLARESVDQRAIRGREFATARELHADRTDRPAAREKDDVRGVGGTDLFEPLDRTGPCERLGIDGRHVGREESTRVLDHDAPRGRDARRERRREEFEFVARRAAARRAEIHESVSSSVSACAS